MVIKEPMKLGCSAAYVFTCLASWLLFCLPVSPVTSVLGSVVWWSTVVLGSAPRLQDVGLILVRGGIFQNLSQGGAPRRPRDIHIYIITYYHICIYIYTDKDGDIH